MFSLVTRLSERTHVSRPPQGPDQAILYVAHHSADAELRTEPLIKELVEAEPSLPLYTCDVRGIGESRPATCGADSFANPYGSDYFYAVHSFMLERPYAGQKTQDILRVLDWLAGSGHSRVHLAAAGWGTVPAIFAALLSDRVAQVTLKGAPASYASIAESEEYNWPLSCFLHGVLGEFDLPDCYHELEKTRRLRMMGV